jgi:hypothetical protein
MLNGRIPRVKEQAAISLAVFVVGTWLAYEIGGKIAGGDLQTLEFAALGFGLCASTVAILRDWRTGFYFFLIWLLFEDLARKYMGNGLALFFGKDIVAALTYISLFVAIRRGRAKAFRPPFLLPLAIFVWLGFIQIFNPNSPHILYGLLGFKVDFFYIPLIWVGYALIRSDESLRKFLVANAVIAAVIGGVGIIQGIVGNSFLNPPVLAPELRELGDLSKVSPISGQVFNLPDSVFVSTGRFGAYLLVASILLIGGAGYLVLHARKGRKVVYLAIGIVAAAALLSGSRGTVVYMASSALVLAVGLLWGAPWGWHQAHRLVKAIRRTFIISALALAAILLIFPEEAGSRIAFYTETLLPSSSTFQGTFRAWDYPLENLMLAFTNPHWVLGNGIGLASLGRQYVANVLKQPAPGLWMEEGFGVLIVELGIVAPFLWILWAGALVYSSWNIVRRLRGTRLFPIAFAICWYAFLLLFPITWGGLSVYQNYINNAYMWLLIGILFRLPDILANTTPLGPRLEKQSAQFDETPGNT